MKRVSACSFIMEPGDLWQRRITRRYYYRAPSISVVDGAATFLCPGEPAIRVPVNSVPWRDEPSTTANIWQRRDVLENAEIEAEVIFPTFAWSLFAIRDADFQLACLRSYNNWMSGLCLTGSTRRFNGVALIPAGEAGARELERCAKMRLKAAVVCATVQTKLALNSAASYKMPVLLTRPAGPTPLTDLAAFSKDSLALAGEYASSGASLMTLNAQSIQVAAGPMAGLSAWALAEGAAKEGLDADCDFARNNAINIYNLSLLNT
jgi:hypothetical protein